MSARLILTLSLALLWPGAVPADDKAFRLAVPSALTESGLPAYLVPRFALKTATRVTLVEPGADAEAAFGSDGPAVFEGLGRVWHLAVGPDPDARRFADWLGSEIGRNTVESYAPDGAAAFKASLATVAPAAPSAPTEGDALRGETLSLAMCGRCHVVGLRNRMDAIGSTPSFAVLKALPDWRSRFESFYVLNPHPAFTQIADVTPPFDPARPPPIKPLELTLDDLDHMLAFMATVAAADLGAPIQSQ